MNFVHIGLKPITSSFRSLGLITVLGVLASMAATAPAANAQANLVFTGGSGTPLMGTLLAPVTYTITSAATSTIPAFVFQGAGFATGQTTARDSLTASTVTYSINGGKSLTTNFLGTGFTDGSIAGTDSYTYDQDNVNFSSISNFNVGDKIVLTAGTFFTSVNVAAPAPASMSYTTFIANAGDTAVERLSSNGISAGGAAAAPEPGSIALLALSGVPVLGLIARRRRNAA